jgi:hypothetical protein
MPNFIAIDKQEYKWAIQWIEVYHPLKSYSHPALPSFFSFSIRQYLSKGTANA